jgi:TPR repeat protein
LKLLAAIIFAAFCIGCAERAITPNERFNFRSEKERRDTERHALAGDNAAAKRVGDYCYFIKNDRAACIRWYKLAASRGDKTAKENVETLLAE